MGPDAVGQAAAAEPGGVRGAQLPRRAHGGGAAARLGANNFCFFHNFKPDTTIGRKQFDLAVDKGFDLGDFTVGLRADMLNVFNWENPDSYENFRGFDGVPNAAYGHVTAGVSRRAHSSCHSTSAGDNRHRVSARAAGQFLHCVSRARSEVS